MRALDVDLTSVYSDDNAFRWPNNVPLSAYLKRLYSEQEYLVDLCGIADEVGDFRTADQCRLLLGRLREEFESSCQDRLVGQIGGSIQRGKTKF